MPTVGQHRANHEDEGLYLQYSNQHDGEKQLITIFALNFLLQIKPSVSNLC